MADVHFATVEFCEMHISHLPTAGDESGLRKLGINLTSEPRFTSRNLFME